MRMDIRPIHPEDRAMARALAMAELSPTPYLALSETALEAALGGGTVESRGLVAADPQGEIVGLVVFGLVAGAVGTGRLHLLAVTAAARQQGTASALIDAAVAQLSGEGARAAFIEMPDDPRLRPAFALLLRGGFTEEARVADYFRDGVPLVLLRRDVD